VSASVWRVGPARVLGTVTLDELRRHVRNAVSVGLQALDDDRLDLWINEAYLELGGLVDWWLERRASSPLAGGVTELDVPEGFAGARRVYTSGGRWQQVSSWDVQRLRRDGVGDAVGCWAWEAGQLLLAPGPGEAASDLTLVYLASPERLLTASDPVRCPDVFVPFVKASAARRAAQSRENLESYRKAQSEYESALGVVLRRPDPTPVSSEVRAGLTPGDDDPWEWDRSDWSEWGEGPLALVGG